MSENNNDFENKLKELEEIATNLERGNLNLEDAILNFEKGIKLSKECSDKLDNAEKRINILISNDDGSFKEEKFEEE